MAIARISGMIIQAASSPRISVDGNTDGIPAVLRMEFEEENSRSPQ